MTENKMFCQLLVIIPIEIEKVTRQTLIDYFLDIGSYSGVQWLTHILIPAEGPVEVV